MYLVTPNQKCRLRLLRQERVKDYILMEQEFIQNQERLKPRDQNKLKEKAEVEKMRGMPLMVANLEEIIDDDHVIVNQVVDYYVPMLSIVNRDLIEPNSSVLLHH